MYTHDPQLLAYLFATTSIVELLIIVANNINNNKNLLELF